MLAVRRVSLVLALLAVAACHGGASADVATVTAEIGPYLIEPGEEKTQCVVFRLDNPAGGFIRRIRAELGERSHHMTIYHSAATTEQLVPFACRGFDSVLQGDRPLFIAQEARAELTFPDDEKLGAIGFAIDPHQMVRMELHYLNTTAVADTGGGRFILETVPLSTTVTPADIGFWGTTDIHIPPHAAWKTPVKFVLGAPENKIFALTTHQHHLGTRMRVWFADDARDIAGAPVADGRNWSDPPLETFDPPLVFGPRGKAGLAYQCEWINTTASQVTYGEGFGNEMCFLWQYYFPGRGFDHFVQP